MTEYCCICKCLLDNPNDMPGSNNCGGDCARCMASLGDPQAMMLLGVTNDDD